MRIYVDFDDCLCETGRAFSKIVPEMFNKHVPYEQIRYFELDRSFGLDAEQYERFMLRVHEPEILLSYDATPGAAETINEWISCGHDVSIITGRPSSVYETSRIWLDEHGLKKAGLYCLNKYGRDHFIKNSNSTLELEDYYRMKFDYAVEDSPKAFRFFEHLPELKVLVFDRPWNRECAFPNGNYQRCADWESIRRIVAGDRKRDRRKVKMKDYTAYCGLDCETCEAHIATVNNDNDLRIKVAKEWSELNKVEITPEMINCAGCRIDGAKTPFCDSLCPIRQCALGKAAETCGDCDKMSTCEKLAMITGNNEDLCQFERRQSKRRPFSV